MYVDNNDVVLWALYVGNKYASSVECMRPYVILGRKEVFAYCNNYATLYVWLSVCVFKDVCCVESVEVL